MLAHVFGVGHIGAFDGLQRKVLKRVDRGRLVVDLGHGGGVAGEGVKLVRPFGLRVGGAEPLGKGDHSLGFLGGAALAVEDAQVLGDVVGAVGDVNQRPVFRLQGARQRMLRAVGRAVHVAVERAGVEGRNLDLAAVQGIKAVAVAGVDAVLAVVPQGLPALHGDAARRGFGIGEGEEHGAVDVGVGGAADLALTVPGVAAIHDVSPVLEAQGFAVGAQLVGAVEHQHVLDDQAVGLAVVLVLAHFVGPGGGPVHHLEVLVGAVDQLGPAGLVQTEDDVAVLVLIGGLDGGGVAGDDAVVIQRDGEASGLGGILQPGGALGGVGVGVDADGVAAVILPLRAGKGAYAQDH